MGTLWFVVLALVLAAFVLLDGFDIGVGVIYLFISRNDDERRATVRGWVFLDAILDKLAAWDRCGLRLQCLFTDARRGSVSGVDVEDRAVGSTLGGRGWAMNVSVRYDILELDLRAHEFVVRMRLLGATPTDALRLTLPAWILMRRKLKT